MKKILLLATSILATMIITLMPANAQVSVGVAAIDTLEGREQLRFLAADELKGRLTGSNEARITAQYILSELRRLGYEPRLEKFVAMERNMQNVILNIPGVDTTTQIVVGAHYDHLGMGAYGDAFNGADDNASGIVAVLQIAKAIKASGLTPKRTIVLAFWDGEEIGLHGSKNYMLNRDSATVKGYMNFDMIGRETDANNPNLFRYIYTEANPQYQTFLQKAIDNYSLNIDPHFKPWDKPTSGSDNASFAKKNVPIAWFHTDGNADYHKVTDTYDKICWAKMFDIIRASYLVQWEMANE